MKPIKDFSAQNSQLERLLTLVNHYPSPHNGQPIILAGEEPSNLNVYFDTLRGLTATPVSYLFSFVTVGVFIRHFELCAEALGHRVSLNLMLPLQTKMSSGEKLKLAEAKIQYDAAEPKPELERLIISRQTSRKKYKSGISNAQAGELKKIAKNYNLSLQYASLESSPKIIWLNQRAVFDDMFDEAVRKELNQWLRYSEDEKVLKKDGLAYDCMELSGTMLKFIVRHYRILRWPIVAQLLRSYYIRTMKDKSTVGYISAPFKTEKEAYVIGRAIIEMWIELSRHGAYLHPFGTIVSNEAAHLDFTELVGMKNEARDNYVVFIFRAGTSTVPVRSLRIPVNKHLYKKIT